MLNVASFIPIVCFADFFSYLIIPQIFKAILHLQLKYCVTVLEIIPEISPESVMTGADTYLTHGRAIYISYLSIALHHCRLFESIPEIVFGKTS